jgi:predicted Zn-dependent protease
VSGKPQDAENAYKKALEKDPNRGSSAQLLFDLYAQSKRFDDAKKMLDERLQKNPSNAGAVIAMRGNLYEAQGKTDEARKDYEKALESDPNQIIAGNNLAYLLADQGRDLDTALKYAQNLRSRQPEDPNIADTLGWVYYKMRRSLLARDSVRFAASKDPDNPVFQYHLGVIYKANNQPADAEAALKKALASPRQFKERADADAALKDIDRWRHLVK